MILRRQLIIEVPHVGGISAMWNVAQVRYHVGFFSCGTLCAIFPSILFSAWCFFHVRFSHAARFPYGIFLEQNPPTRLPHAARSPHEMLPCETHPLRSSPAPNPPHANLAPRDNSRLARSSPQQTIFVYFPKLLPDFLANILPTRPISPLELHARPRAQCFSCFFFNKLIFAVLRFVAFLVFFLAKKKNIQNKKCKKMN